MFTFNLRFKDWEIDLARVRSLARLFQLHARQDEDMDKQDLDIEDSLEQAHGNKKAQRGARVELKLQLN